MHGNNFLTKLELKLDCLNFSSVAKYWKLAKAIEEYRSKFFAKWKASRLDAMVCPTFPYVAPPTGAVKYLLGMFVFLASFLLWLFCKLTCQIKTQRKRLVIGVLVR